MKEYLFELKGSFSLVFMSIVVLYILMYLEGVITGKKYSNSTYLKVAIWTGVLSYFHVYVSNLGPFAEEILAGPPPF